MQPSMHPLVAGTFQDHASGTQDTIIPLQRQVLDNTTASTTYRNPQYLKGSQLTKPILKRSKTPYVVYYTGRIQERGG